MKKGLLGIVAIFMAIALALTGCGQQGEQNAGATGSESQSGTITDNGNANNGEATAEPDSKRPSQDADGNYVYTITLDDVQTEIRTCVNVWDYIVNDTPYDRVDLTRMAEDLGWERLSTGFGAVKYAHEDGNLTSVYTRHDGEDYYLPTGEKRAYNVVARCLDASGDVIKFSGDIVASETECVSGDPYLIGGSSVYVSFDQIVAYAYLVDHYRYNIEPAFETDLNAVTDP